jgi:large subunit ribosomal protein L3
MSATETKETAAKASLPLDCVYAVKAGQTRVFTEGGEAVPVTVLNLLEGTVVTQVKTQANDGYSALQLGFRAKKQQRTKNAEKGHFKASGAPGFYWVEEFKLKKDLEASAGAVVSPDFLEVGKFVDVRAKSKGKGFQGVMKRYNFAGGRDSHGHSVSHRSGGSIGMRQTPGRVMPGKKMAGHMGAEFLTVQNLKVVEFDKEKNLLLVRGAVPGHKSSVIRITKSIKRG